MSERAWRNVFVFGTLLFFLILIGMTVVSLAQVTGVRTPGVTDQVMAGKRTWQDKNCNDCHTILGIGGYFAPEMTKVADRRDANYLLAWLKDPQATKPGTTMPNQNLTDAQAQNLVAFFQWVVRVDTNNWPPQPVLALGTAGGAPPGAALFAQLGCSSCHRINGQGATGPGPDLSHIGSQPYDSLPNSADFLTKWLENPAAQKPGTIMPTIPMTTDQRGALVQYLVGLK
jgi:nitric oxide reductase subunit C